MSTRTHKPVECEPSAEVEHCAGSGQLSKGFNLLGYAGTRYDVPWIICTRVRVRMSSVCLTQKTYSGNHDFMRTVGFLVLMGAATQLHLDVLPVCTICSLPAKLPEVMNAAPYGFLMCAPPCSSWVFMQLGLDNGLAPG